MKIAIVVHYFPPKHIGGTEIASFNIAKYLVQKGHEVHVITWLDSDFPKNNMEEGFYIHRVFGKNIRFLTTIFYWFKIFICLKSIHPDIIHVQNFGLGISAFFSKKFFRTPYLIYARGSENIFDRSFILKKITKLVITNADKLLVLTKDMKKELKMIYNGEILVVPNGIELDRFKNLSKRKLQKINKKTIIFVGRLYSVKGLIYLIEAMVIIQNEENNTNLLIIGIGPEKKSLEMMVKKLHLEHFVKFIGDIAYTEIPKYLVQADVFALPSVSEGFPNVILEAMAAGLPIVSTNIGGLSEIIHNEENGYLVEPKNSEQLAYKILEILKNPEIGHIMSLNNMEKVKEYSWESVIESLENIYINILTTSKGKI